VTRSMIVRHKSSGGTRENHENPVITGFREEIKRRHAPYVEHKCRPLPRDIRCSDLLLEWLNFRVKYTDKPVPVHSWKAYGYGGTAVPILNLGTNTGVRLVSRYVLFIPRETAPCHPSSRWLDEPQFRPGIFGGKSPFACTGN